MKCPRCDHNSTYIRIKNKELVCRTCGFTGAPDTIVDEKDKIYVTDVRIAGGGIPANAIPVPKEESLKRLDKEIAENLGLIKPIDSSEP